MRKNGYQQVMNSLSVDRLVWVKADSSYSKRQEESFLEGKVIDIVGEFVMVDLTDSLARIKVPISNCLKLTYGPSDVADMVDLQELNEPELLYNIKRRYANDLIFTYCGPTLVIVNPYRPIDKLFNESALQDYQQMVFTDSLEYKSMSPHIFGLAAFCLWQLFDNERSQSIVISGQSGAGKTQSTKYCLKFLASLGRNMKELLENSPSSFGSGNKSRRIDYQNMRAIEKAIRKTNSKLFGIEQEILGCNEILEAFGNAKTIRNDNSSRFGKLILLVYGKTQIDIKSTVIISYLLEKSRIVSVADGERNYHIFYYFCKGTSAEEKKKYKLKDSANKYYYLSQSSTYELPHVSDADRFELLKTEFELYLVPEQIDGIFRILSMVLNIGNLLFEKSENKNNEEIAIIKNVGYIKDIAQLLEVDYASFEHSFRFKTRKLGVSVINSPLKYDEALALRDSFAKNIYEQVFNFLVRKLNDKIEIEKVDLENMDMRSQRKSIGLLDIFGFEVLQINSLEQFLINFANEKLQQLYVSYIFKEEQNEFLREGLKEFSHDIGFQDNKPIIDLFEEFPSGIFHSINESSQLNRDDMSLPDIIAKKHPKSPAIVIPKSKRGMFQINHSCSPVVYNTQSFTAKNKDSFPNQLLQAIMESKNAALKAIIIGSQPIPDKPKHVTASSKFLGSKFLNEMNKLTEELYSCDCHFVRCIKPNNKKTPKLITPSTVLQSLRYLGVLDSIIIRKLGYIYRRPFKEFYKKFLELERYIIDYADEIKDKSEEEFKLECRKIVDKYAKKELSDNKILFGATKILIKESALNQLELLTKEKRRLRIQTSNRIKTMCRNSMFRGKAKEFLYQVDVLKTYMTRITRNIREEIRKKKIKKVQVVVREYLWQLRLGKNKEKASRAITLFSARIKMVKQRQLYLETRAKVIRLQAIIRTFNCTRKHYKQEVCRIVIRQCFTRAWDTIKRKSAERIQRLYRGYIVRKSFLDLLKMMKMRAFAKRAIVKFRFLCFKQLLMMYKTPVVKLQRVVRTRYLRRTFLQVRKNTVLIQRAFRKHLNQKNSLIGPWKVYRNHLNACENQKTKEYLRIGINVKQFNPDINPNETTRVLRKLSPEKLADLYGSPTRDEPRDVRVNSTVYYGDKNTMQAYIGDIDLLSTFSYRGLWTAQLAKAKEEMAKKSEYPLCIKVDQHFTTIISNRDRLYNFSCCQQPYESLRIGINESPTVLSLNQGVGRVVTKDGRMYEWGNNWDHELFLETGQTAVALSTDRYVGNIVDVQSRGKHNYYVESSGKVYYKQETMIEELSFGNKIQIELIVASYRFVHFLTTNGIIYSKGCNSCGELGFGKASSQVQEPQVNQFLRSKKEMIETVSVGIGHTVAKSKLGYVYFWGQNDFGQISMQPSSYIASPFCVEIDRQRVKALQAVAGLRASFILLDSFHIVGSGTSATLSTLKSNSFQQLDLISTTNMNSKNLVPVKLSCTWTREMSLLVVNCLQLNKCRPGSKPETVLKYCKGMAREWKEKSIYPPYHEWMDNILNLSDMRKFKFQEVHKVRAPSADTPMESELGELKVLMDLRKTSTLFKNAARNKVEQIVMRIGSKPQKLWTPEEHEINAYINSHCRSALK